MYLPPNAASNASFLETLRLMLVHELRDARGVPRDLELAFATPRAWLEPGNEVVVCDLPTSFGTLSFSIESRPEAIHISIDVPRRSPARALRLRLRLPRGQRVVQVRMGEAPRPLDRRSSTIDLSGLEGRVELIAAVRRD
jgi:hypothetical protein